MRLMFDPMNQLKKVMERLRKDNPHVSEDQWAGTERALQKKMD
ncbi:hypothetical protein ABZ816_20805 [Actinosynnema sp. NPDC047251]|nr:hypothetical protein [Saccharothrix espanaensis]